MTENLATTPPANRRELLKNHLLLDFEIDRGGRLYDIGAILGSDTFRRKGETRKSLEALADFARDATVVVGHNLSEHDLPFLRAFDPNHPVLEMPVMDTLLLSPVCFPENPYHRLLKEYKIVRDSLSDPVADARLSGELLAEEMEVLSGLHRTNPEIASFHLASLTGEGQLPKVVEGFEFLWKTLGIPSAKEDTSKALFRQATLGKVCASALEAFLDAHFPPKPAHSYVLAWLLVAGSSSVLPLWVRHKFKEIPDLIRKLRDQPCSDEKCAYCRETHNPREQLRKFFRFDGFRAEPAGEEGKSLQEAIVMAGMGDNPLLAILPTGGGKSLGFQLPALTRHFRRGVLTVVLSPLQALMKDQVDNMRKLTGLQTAIDTLNGLQSPPERGAVYERLVLGDVAILYVSPEQLRNRRFRDAVSKREIGCWVFDEAHCLSKWGHDFRPDYTYAGRFIRELADEQGEPKPPAVACFTATAKKDVKEELLEYFKRELGQELEVFDGGSERNNLSFDVVVVTEHQKLAKAHELLSEHLAEPENGSAVVFCSTRNAVEDLAMSLQRMGWQCEGFHAGLDNEKKTEILDLFNEGGIKVICATNAFGMGVDKPDVRLVLHHDIPGSLENYVQEAGRAGRDGLPAKCVLLFNPGNNGRGGDINEQFRMDSFGRINRTDVRRILNSIRKRPLIRNDKDESPYVYLSAVQILERIAKIFENDQAGSKNTKVRAAIANLENNEFLRRNENQNRVFQGVPLVETMVKASEIIDRQNLPDANEKAWKEIYRTFLNLPPKVQPDLEVFTDLPALTPLVERQGTDNDATRIVFRILNEMSRVEVGLIRKDVRYSAIVRHKVENNSRDNLSKFVQLERESISLIRESAPDVEIGEYWPLNLRSLISRLHELEFNWCLTEHVHRLLGVIRLDGTGFSSRTNSRSLVPKELGHGQFRIKLERSWDNIEELSRKRVAVAGVLLECIHGKIPAKAPASATLQVDFDETDLLDAIKSDITLGPEISDAHAAIEHGLRYLHEMGVIQLKGGIALITQAMRLDLEEASLNRQYKKVDHDTLEVHYTERNLQIHVMAEYAMLAEKKLEEALGLVVDYFNLDKTEFIKKHFQGRKKLIELATSVESYNRIIESLNNRHQQAIVASPVNRNLLVLAGPGSGKTRVVAHRCAYLLRVKRIKPAQLLVLCYNRSAAITLRRRIHDLAGTDSSGITICTFHSLALRLLGISAADTFPRGAEHDQETQSKFQEIIPRATALLDGVAKVPGMDKEQIFNSLIGSWSHFLIDEYQDVDEQQYAFISAIAGRVTKNPDTKLSIMAVGDDDQNIYNFRGASTRFIRSFEEDYKAKTEHLTENYRSTTNIISASNHLIEQNRDRMKTDHPIIINRARSDNPKGGEWEKLDSVGKGFVQVLPTADLSSQTTTIVSEIKRLREISPGEVSWNDFAVLGRGRPQLTPIRALLESEELPVQWACGLHHGIPLSRLREIQEGFDTIIQRKDDDDKSSSLTAQELLELFPEREEQSQSPWQKLFGQLLLDWCREIGESSVDLDNCMHFLYEALMQMRNEHRHGDGVYVGTAHGAKGLEFKHVFIADGGWETREESLEEERRLYYVAMTRAMENLLLLSRGDRQDNFADVISGAEGAIVRAFSEATASDPNILSRRYDFLGMKDLYLDLGSRDRSVREAVGKLRTDDPLFMRETEDRVSVFDVSDQRVATLSAGASAEWKPRLADVESAKVFAIARRHRDDCSPEYRDQCIAETWEVPLVEVVLNESTTEPAN